MSLEVSTFLPPAEMSARNRNLWGVGKKVHTMAGCTLLLSSNFLILSGLPHLKKRAQFPSLQLSCSKLELHMTKIVLAVLRVYVRLS